MDIFSLHFKEIQNHPTPVWFSWNKSLDYLGFSSSSAWRDFAQMFINSFKDLQSCPNAYHNEVHSAEAIYSAAILIKEEFTGKDILYYGPYLLFAMMCHDIEHNGSNNKTHYELEKKAVNCLKKQFKNSSVQEYWRNNFLKDYGSLLKFQRRIERIILGTEFKIGVIKNMLAYQNNLYQNPFVKLNMLANEADIFVSVMNDLGEEKGVLLAKEQNQPSLASLEGRIFFLEHLAHYVSSASEKLGIQEYLKNQINSLKTM